MTGPQRTITFQSARPNRALAPLLLTSLLLLAGCAGGRGGVGESGEPGRTGASAPSAGAAAAEPTVASRSTQGATAQASLPQAQILATDRHLQCVPYAREISNVSIRGNAWTWWQSAAGRYGRNNRPAIGAVLVLKKTSRLRYGHVAVVSRVLNSREILVDHANWLNRGRIHKDLPVRDVSPNNDWSEVRVWYAPGHTLGKRRYPAYGFIHPEQGRNLRLQAPVMRGPDVRVLQERLIDEGFAVTADGVFGPQTRDALAAYQERKGLAQDGVAGPSTRASLGI